MMLLRKITFLGVAVGMLLPVQAAPEFGKMFARLDANRDGAVTWKEAYEVRASEFVALDDNLDGIVDEKEFGGRVLPFSRFDGNSDGKLELSEYVGQHRRMFEQADANGDGTLNQDEFIAAQKSIRSRKSGALSGAPQG